MFHSAHLLVISFGLKIIQKISIANYGTNQVELRLSPLLMGKLHVKLKLHFFFLISFNSGCFSSLLLSDKDSTPLLIVF